MECGNLLPPYLAKFISRHLWDGINSVVKGGGLFEYWNLELVWTRLPQADFVIWSLDF